jgi:hypothetical protein
LTRALAYFTEGDGAELDGERYVLLATDGGPNCDSDLTCSAESCTVNLDGICPPNTNCCDAELDPDGPAKCLDDDGSVAAVAALAEAGIRTFVVGIPGTEAYPDTLDRLAEAGGVANPDAPPSYFAVSAEGGVAGLSDVFERITTGLITSCRLQLEEEPPAKRRLFVVVDGVVIEHDAVDGWELDDTSSPPVVQLNGATCEKLEAEGAEQVIITYDCPITDPH